MKINTALVEHMLRRGRRRPLLVASVRWYAHSCLSLAPRGRESATLRRTPTRTKKSSAIAEGTRDAHSVKILSTALKNKKT